MNSNQISAIEDTIETIEKNLEKPFHLEELSKEVGISKYHLLRLFKAITDKSLMAYVRGRRLSHSLSDLISSNMNILDIAIKYQFEYEQSYIRAFQNFFHITPAKYRKQKSEMPIEQMIDLHSLKSVGQGVVLQPKMVIRPEFYVQGIKEEIFHEQNLTEFTTNKIAMLFYEKYLPLVPDKVNEAVYFAIILHNSNNSISNDYIPCTETSVLNTVTPPFFAYTIPLQEYAVFRYVGFHSPYEVTYKTLKELYDYIGHWRFITSYTESEPFHFERMDLNICSESYCEMDIYFPIST